MLEIYSNQSNLSLVEPFIDRVAKQCSVKDEVYGNMLVAVTEAVTNAIRHGNCHCSDKLVKVNAHHDCDSVCFVVEDEGDGFDPDSVPDPTSSENILKIGGRGVFLMRQLSDDIRFFHDGRAVELVFKL